jgi:hypothetical protein
MLDDHAMLRTVDPPGSINKPRHPTQQWHEQPGTLGQQIIDRCQFETARTSAVNVRVRRNDNLNVTGLAFPRRCVRMSSYRNPGKC